LDEEETVVAAGAPGAAFAAEIAAAAKTAEDASAITIAGRKNAVIR
jgi:hypothetical protein